MGDSRDEAMALHWIDRYAAGIDDEPNLEAISEALAAQHERIVAGLEARLLEATTLLRRLRDCSDIEMGDGDLARELAAAFLAQTAEGVE